MNIFGLKPASNFTGHEQISGRQHANNRCRTYTWHTDPHHHLTKDDKSSIVRHKINSKVNKQILVDKTSKQFYTSLDILASVAATFTYESLKHTINDENEAPLANFPKRVKIGNPLRLDPEGGPMASPLYSPSDLENY